MVIPLAYHQLSDLLVTRPLPFKQERRFNLGTDAFAKTITLGNATGTTSVNINSGTGGVILNTTPATNITHNMGTTGSAIFASSTANSDKIAIFLNQLRILIHLPELSHL